MKKATLVLSVLLTGVLAHAEGNIASPSKETVPAPTSVSKEIVKTEKVESKAVANDKKLVSHKKGNKKAEAKNEVKTESKSEVKKEEVK